MDLPKKLTAASIRYPKVVSIRAGKQLQSLYARRSAVETLIRSLEEYQRFRVRRMDQRQPKSA